MPHSGCSALYGVNTIFLKNNNNNKKKKNRKKTNSFNTTTCMIMVGKTWKSKIYFFIFKEIQHFNHTNSHMCNNYLPKRSVFKNKVWNYLTSKLNMVCVGVCMEFYAIHCQAWIKLNKQETILYQEKIATIGLEKNLI